MKTVLIYVLSAQFPPYDRMIGTAMETWDTASMDNVQTIYYCGAPDRPNTNRIVYFPVEESYATMGQKDLLAYQWALENRQWDYMARPHSSCYVHKRRLLQEVQGLPDTGVFRGLVVPNHPYCGTGRPFVWGGGHFIMSRDVVAEMVQHGDGLWRHDLMEDVAMSELVQDLGFVLDSRGKSCSINKQTEGWNCITYGSEIGGFDFTDFTEVSRLTDQYFFRVKNDGDRSVDAETMTLLKQHLPA